MNNLGVNTDNFYKFITTLSLVCSIYCLSFDKVYLAPYNSKITELNIEKAKLTAEIGYLKGLSLDLYSKCKDSITGNKIQYFYWNKKDSSEMINYYSNINTSENIKKTVDRLNKINREYAINLFKTKAIRDTQKVMEQNQEVRTNIFLITGTLSFIIFIFSLIIWYKKRKSIDK